MCIYGETEAMLAQLVSVVPAPSSEVLVKHHVVPVSRCWRTRPGWAALKICEGPEGIWSTEDSGVSVQYLLCIHPGCWSQGARRGCNSASGRRTSGRRGRREDRRPRCSLSCCWGRPREPRSRPGRPAPALTLSDKRSRR